MRVVLRFVVLGVLLQSGWVVAMPAEALAENAGGGQSSSSPAGAFIQSLGDRAMAVVNDANLTPEQRKAHYHELLREAFDLPAIGRFVIGRAWNTATPEQQQEYMKLFEALIVRTYGDRLNMASGKGFRVQNVRQENDRNFIVTSAVTQARGAPPTRIDWRVRQTGDKFAILDVIVEGVSLSVTQRQEYAAIIQRDGGRIDGLLQTMRQRVEGQGGSPAEGGETDQQGGEAFRRRTSPAR